MGEIIKLSWSWFGRLRMVLFRYTNRRFVVISAAEPIFLTPAILKPFSESIAGHTARAMRKMRCSECDVWEFTDGIHDKKDLKEYLDCLKRLRNVIIENSAKSLIIQLSRRRTGLSVLSIIKGRYLFETHWILHVKRSETRLIRKHFNTDHPQRRPLA